MNFNKESKNATADKRNGVVEIYRNSEDEIHLTWRDANTNNLQLDLYLFAFDTEIGLI